MVKLRECERDGCAVLFDISDHKHQRFCSKSCAKIGTQHRHHGAESSRPGLLAHAVEMIQQGKSYRQAHSETRIPTATIFLAVKRIQEATDVPAPTL